MSAWFSPIFANRYADLTDLDIFKKSLNSTLFPGAPSDALIHGGFADEHETTATTILIEVQGLLSLHSASTVVSVGCPDSRLYILRFSQIPCRSATR